jgi:hypothetical protein
MILISHRGNINGKNIERENHPDYIDEAIELDFDVEIDLWTINNNFYLGHDKPQYNISLKWIEQRLHKLWIHCKNIPALECAQWFTDRNDLNYFWHEEDTVTLTSKNYIWAYPGKQPIKSSIAVMPEINNDDITQCIGICSDYIEKYKK